jgi:hypothetical protein
MLEYFRYTLSRERRDDQAPVVLPRHRKRAAVPREPAAVKAGVKAGDCASVVGGQHAFAGEQLQLERVCFPRTAARSPAVAAAHVPAQNVTIFHCGKGASRTSSRQWREKQG